MITLHNFSQLRRLKNITFVATIGNFDGVHRAHRKILTDLKHKVRRTRARSLVITFDRHPQRLGVGKKKPILTALTHKLLLIERYGVQYCFVFRFNRSLKNQTAQAFLTQVLFKHFPLTYLIVGYNFRFGKDRLGTPEMIAAAARMRAIGCTVTRPITQGRVRVSSSRIRTLIARGKLAPAAQLLGRPYSVFADVIRGAGRGVRLGYPTANLDVHSEVLPPCGVYIVTVNVLTLRKQRTAAGVVIRSHVRRRQLRGLVSLGYQPTFHRHGAKGRRPWAEVHIIGFTGNLRGTLLEVTFIKKIRNEWRFASARTLAAQIAKDIAKARAYFRR